MNTMKEMVKKDSDLREEGLQVEEIDEKNKSELAALIKTIAVAFGVTLFLNSAVLVNAMVPSSSMEGTLYPGDRFFGNRLAYQNDGPERFDIIVFKYPDDESLMYVKRVIGLPGERIEIIDGKVYVDGNGEPLNDSFIKEPMIGSFGPYEVPEDSYFVLGDNRNNSNDSRRWKHTFVRRDQILGKGVVIYWPFKHMKLLD